MKIWKVDRIGETDYDEYDGFVVRAEDEQSARKLVQKNLHSDKATWGDPALSTCTEVKTKGAEEVILGSFRAG